MGRKHSVIQIDHEGGGTVYCWGVEQGLDTIKSCIKTHPEESVTIKEIRMTEKQYDALPDYEGDC